MARSPAVSRGPPLWSTAVPPRCGPPLFGVYAPVSHLVSTAGLRVACSSLQAQFHSVRVRGALACRGIACRLKAQKPLSRAGWYLAQKKSCNSPPPSPNLALVLLCVGGWGKIIHMDIHPPFASQPSGPTRVGEAEAIAEINRLDKSAVSGAKQLQRHGASASGTARERACVTDTRSQNTANTPPQEFGLHILSSPCLTKGGSRCTSTSKNIKHRTYMLVAVTAAVAVAVALAATTSTSEQVSSLGWGSQSLL